MKKTKKSASRKKKPMAFILMALALVIAAAAYLFVTGSTDSRKLFCSGKNPKTQEVMNIYYHPTVAQTAEAYIFSKAEAGEPVEKNKGLQATMDNPQTPRRISLKVSEQQTLQVYRECGEKPVCRIEDVQHATAEELKDMEQKLVEAEKTAAESRKKATATAGKYWGLKNQLATAKQKKLKPAAIKKIKDETNELAQELHNYSAQAQDLQRTVQRLRIGVESKGARVELTNLETEQIGNWCPDLGQN
jgi:type I site-specific restriction endonuclease